MIKFGTNRSELINHIGIASDHAGFELKEQIKEMLQKTGYLPIDFGNYEYHPDDDYPDYIVPLAKAVANGNVTRGIAVCGSGVGACIIANKIAGVRACLIHETFSASQGVRDDNMNMICMGGRVINFSLAWELTEIFLSARFSGEERHIRRLSKVTELEKCKK